MDATQDPRAGYDAQRGQCPVHMDEGGAWTLYAHADVQAAALDDVTFSSATSRHLHVPNTMDGAEHTRYRHLIDRYLTPERVADLEPAITAVADEVIDGAFAEAGPDAQLELDAVRLGERFAVLASCDWLGWPRDLADELLDWMGANREASGSGSVTANTIVATWYTNIISRQIRARRGADGTPVADAPDDPTTQLTRDDSLGRPLTDEEITSILRNWTGGDLSSMALCIGVTCAFLADHPDIQSRLRRQDVSDAESNAILDEILRIDDPFVANRRVTTRDVEVGGQQIPKGARVTLNWTAANRDPQTFGDPDAFEPERNAYANLVYGIGRHVCPGRPLATTELRLFTRRLLERTDLIDRAPGKERERAQPPVGGYATVPLLVRRPR